MTYCQETNEEQKKLPDHPLFKVRRAVFTHVEAFRHLRIQSDQQATVEPDGDIRHALTRNDELLVSTEKHVGIQMLHHAVERLGIGINLAVSQMHRRIAIGSIEK